MNETGNIETTTRTTTTKGGGGAASSSSFWRKAVISVVLLKLTASTLRTSSLTATLLVSSQTRLTSVKNGHLMKKILSTDYTVYAPSKIEEYIVTHTKELKLDWKAPDLVPTCQLWTEPTSTPHHKEMMDFVKDLEDYYKRIDAFSLHNNVTDLRRHLGGDPDSDICSQLELDQGGLPAIFSKEKLSYTRAGWVEPLLPPMRHPNWCLDGTPNSLGNLEYLIHDFGHMCRQLKPTSRTILIDMGASLMFMKKWPSPALKLIDLFRKFGLPFDHIYAYELTQSPPSEVFEMVPEHMSAGYHWINVGVDPDPTGRNNPFKLLLENYDDDDLIVVKLDIDSPEIERKLAHQLLNDERLLKMVDHFYFEHHVNQKELAPYWGLMSETVEESLQLFHELRKKGVASHFWT